MLLLNAPHMALYHRQICINLISVARYCIAKVTKVRNSQSVLKLMQNIWIWNWMINLIRDNDKNGDKIKISMVIID